MSYDNLSREELIAALEKAEVSAKKKVVVKVSPKGAVQLNGIRKFPVTFYKDEWATIFSMKDEIETFIQQNETQLAVKAA